MLNGKGISEGIGIGKAVVLKREEIKIEKTKIKDIDKELEKLNVSLNSVIKETQNSIKEISSVLVSASASATRDPPMPATS